MGGAADVDRAVAAARQAFESFSTRSVDERIALIDRIIDVYESYIDEFSELIAREVGIPVSNRAQVTGPADHMRVARDMLRDYPFESRIGSAIVRREPIGVCALISPWNWPIQTGVIKMIYALAAGCTVVAKPSVNSAASGALLAQVLHEAGVPAGVFNLVNGGGRERGRRPVAQPGRGHDLLHRVHGGRPPGGRCRRGDGEASLPGAGREVGQRRAPRRRPREGRAVEHPTCLLQRRSVLPRTQPHAGRTKARLRPVADFLVDEANRFRLGDPLDTSTTMGPVVSAAQFKSIRELIQSGVDEGARLVTGGTRAAERSEPRLLRAAHGLHRRHARDDHRPGGGVRTRPGGHPLPDEDEAVRIANDSPYGLGGYVFGGQRERARRRRESACAPDASASTAPPQIPTHRWAATSSPASAARWAGSGSRSTSRSSPSTGSRTRLRRCHRSSAEDAADTVRLKILTGR